MNAQAVPVYAMPRMEEFLRNNGPWDQLVDLNNISIVPLKPEEQVSLKGAIAVAAFEVPHLSLIHI